MGKRSKQPAQGEALAKASGKRKPMDLSFLLIILALVTYGAIMVFSASYAAAINKYGNSLHYITRHLIYAAIGIVLMLAVSFVNYHLYRRLVFWIFGGALILLILVLLIGDTQGTFARRWLGFGPISFQPSEVMKFALIVLFSHLITVNYKRMHTFTYGVLPFGICLAVLAVLMMLQPHLSGTVILAVIGIIMMFVGGTRIRYFIALLGVGVAGVAGIAVLKGASYIQDRLTMWLDPFQDTTNLGYQTVHSLVAIGSGGIMGRGIGMSRQKYLYIPEPQNDFIFAIICEELGLIGALLVIILFAFLTIRGFSIAQKAPDRFGFMLALGITVQICIQAVFNIAVVTNTLPNTGISLPFFSYGGTALIMQLCEMGVLLNISRQAAKEKEQ